MKKMLMTVAMVCAFGSQAQAFDNVSNTNVMKQVVIQHILTQILNQNSTQTYTNNNLIIHTGNIAQGGTAQCWSKFVYHSDGSRTPRVVCQ